MVKSYSVEAPPRARTPLPEFRSASRVASDRYTVRSVLVILPAAPVAAMPRSVPAFALGELVIANEPALPGVFSVRTILLPASTDPDTRQLLASLASV